MSDTLRRKEFKHLLTIGGTNIWQLKNAPNAAEFFYACGAAIDADGAPTAYGPHGLQGTLDYLDNAGHPGHWWGIVTDKHGRPVVQNGVAPQQPYAGFYISTTALYNDIVPETDVRRWADATKIPYLALPPTDLHITGLKIGDFALLINGINGRYTFAIFADTKNKSVISEISICAASALGINTDAHNGGTARGIIRLVFPNSGLGQRSIPDPDTIAVCGRGLLQHFDRFRDKDSKFPTAFPEYKLFAKALADAGYSG